MSRAHQPRRYPRSARVNEVVRETIADELERLSDPRLGLVTVTGVDVSPDLRQATVYYSALETAVGGRVRPRRASNANQASQANQPENVKQAGRSDRSSRVQRLDERERRGDRDDGVREVDAAAARLADTRAALESAAPHLRAELGRQVRLKYTPELTFREDPAVASGNRIEEILRDLHRDDAVGGTDRDGPEVSR